MNRKTENGNSPHFLLLHLLPLLLVVLAVSASTLPRGANRSKGVHPHLHQRSQLFATILPMENQL